MTQADYNELRQDLGKAMTSRQGFAVMKKFLRKAGAGFIPGRPDSANGRLSRAFEASAENFFGVQIPPPKARTASGAANCYCAAYTTAGDADLTWLYFDDLKKGVVVITYDDARPDGCGFFSLRDHWVD